MLTNKQKNNKKIFLKAFIIFFLFLTVAFKPAIASEAVIGIAGTAGGHGITPDQYDQLTEAGLEIKVKDNGDIVAVGKMTLQARLMQLKTWALDKFWNETVANGAAHAFWSALSSALNTLAYDTATWIGSGGEGQKPLFVTEDWGAYLSNVADNAAGTFIEDLGKNGMVKFNLCEPSFAVKMKIGLGLVNQERPTAPACTFTKMLDNWDQAIQDSDFLPKFQDMFNPTSNDLGIALSLQTGLIEQVDQATLNSSDYIKANQGWLDVRNISGTLKGIPTQQNVLQRTQFQSFAQALSLNNFTGTFVDAVNIFLNQLAITLYNRLMGNLANSTISSPYSGNYGGFSSYESSPISGGTTATENSLKKIIQPNFTVRGDYDILAELASCPDPTKAGPTNCVIDEKFRQAIQNKLTVGEALDQSYLTADGVFGYLANGLEPNYQEGYPYRSMTILRKFRIIPVGWEVAAQTLKKNNESYNIKKVVDCFNSNSAECQGLTELVDPNWVLKAPQNYCKKEGPGPEIISTQAVGAGGNSVLTLLRNDNYCADEQSCIKEEDNDSCLYYGYCTEEKRIWQFDSDACEPVYNTCQTFRSSNGNTVSYLKNTLDYCDANGVGCTEYSRDYNYGSRQWQGNSNIWFNSQAEKCASDNEGCHQLIRTKADLGTNLIKDASFENRDSDYWGAAIQFTNNDSYDGLYAAQKNSGSLIKYFDVGENTLGSEYILSFDAKKCSGATYSFSVDNVGGSCIDGVCGQTITTNDAWKRFVINYNFKINNPQKRLRFAFDFPDSTCLIDAIQLEKGSDLTDYKGYGQSGTVYEKLVPNYLLDANNNCIGSEAVCGQYAQFCQASEAGCELYTSQTDGTAVPAKISFNDNCNAKCVGFDTYIQRETPFENLRPAYFIPSTAKTCSADAVGCDEFTNLDKVAQGGESREYYSYLKQCILPDTTQCADFITWQSTDESGYQVEHHSLKQDVDGAPAVTDNMYEGKTCATRVDYDPINNPLCREFTDKNGQVHYAFSIYTITCSTDCHPYRRTGVNTDDSIAELDCNKTNEHWNGEACVVCKNGGTWSEDQGACIYMAIPNEGKICSSSQVGCRAYSGNRGANYQVVSSYSFDDSIENWQGVNSTIEKSSQSLTTGGGSLHVKDGQYEAKIVVGTTVNTSSDYVMNFLAMAPNGANLEVMFVDSAGHIATTTAYQGGAAANQVSLDNEWKLYTVNINLKDYYLSHTVDANESLVIKGTSSFYLDSFKLISVIDRYYLIKNSWVTDAVCNQDNEGNPYPLFALGCDHYQDRDGIDKYLHSFSSLCKDSAVGCELLIDTHNSSYYSATTTVQGISVAADNYVYAVYDKGKVCNSADKGCEFLGQKYSYGSELLYSDVYLKNNPDKYGSILCDSSQVGCKAWISKDGTAYFKDPGNMICEWRDNQWYKTKIKRCGSTGEICASDKDCGNSTFGTSCQIETANTVCSTDYLKTLGTGGEFIGQPGIDGDGNWVGICPTSQDGCTEYIDPISGISTNLIDNPTCNTIGGVNCATWDSSTDPRTPPYTKDLDLDRNTLYVLSANTNTAVQLNSNTDTMRILGMDNNFSLPIIATSSDKLFLTNNGGVYTITGGENGKTVSVRKAIVEYRIKYNINNSSCTVPNFEKGCVYFNERTVQGKASNDQLKYNNLKFAAPNYTLNQTTGDTNNATVLLKVTPNRTCDKWLACKSYVKDESGNNICYDIGLCQSLDDKGNCVQYVTTDKQNQTYPNTISTSGISNLSGYSKVGIDGIDLYKIPEDLYNLNNMTQAGEVANLINGGFEFAGSNTYPIGWNYEGSGFTNNTTGATYINSTLLTATSTTLSWNANIFSVLNKPADIKSQGACYVYDSAKNCPLYAPEGQGILRLGANYNATSDFFEVDSNTQYVASAYINTTQLTEGGALMQFISDKGTLLKEIAVAAKAPAWSFKVATTTTDSTLIKIRLAMKPNSKGVAYFDDVKVMPALEVRDQTPANSNDDKYWNIPQSCRLYPEDSSLSCDYYDDSWIEHRGWYGYCLEYDRSPGDPNACILWYPIDRVKGDGLNETGVGYSNKFPLYYCVAATKTPESYETFNGSGFRNPVGGGWAACNNVGVGVCEGQFGFSSVNNGRGCGSPTCAYVNTCSRDLRYYGVDSNTTTKLGYISSSKVCRDYEDTDWPDTSNNMGCLDGDCCYRVTCSYAKSLAMMCSVLVQVVTPTGRNMAYTSRVQEGSDYSLSCNNTNPAGINLTGDASISKTCTYNSSDSTPFGAITSPLPSSNPYEWDSKDTIANTNPPIYAGIQPLYFEGKDNRDYQNNITEIRGARMGQLYDVDNLKKLFAKSYGSWAWTNKTCNTGPIIGGICVDDSNCSTACNGVCAAANGNYISSVTCTNNADCDYATAVSNGAANTDSMVGYCDSGTKKCIGGCNNGDDCSLAVPVYSDDVCKQVGTCACSNLDAGGNCVYTCSNGSKSGQACANNFDCQEASSCDNATGRCNGGFANGQVCVTTTDDAKCADTNCYQCGSYCGGSNQVCSSDNDCTGTCNQINSSGRYVVDSTAAYKWDPPTNICNGDRGNDSCAIVPTINNIKVNKVSGSDYTIAKNGFINLTFNSNVDSDQEPLVMYGVDWGDGDKTVISGISMHDRPNPENPHSLYHLYDYWNLKTMAIQDPALGINCSIVGGVGQCVVVPKIHIKDNWGWCNGNVKDNCTVWQAFSGSIIVKEK